jgi:hypothetical protein
MAKIFEVPLDETSDQVVLFAVRQPAGAQPYACLGDRRRYIIGKSIWEEMFEVPLDRKLAEFCTGLILARHAEIDDAKQVELIDIMLRPNIEETLKVIADRIVRLHAMYVDYDSETFENEAK